MHCPRRPEENVGSPGSEVTGSLELSGVNAGSELSPFGRYIGTLKY